MSLKTFLHRTRLLLEFGLHETRHSFRDQPAADMSVAQLAQLEERIMMSASPAAVVAPEAMDSSATAPESTSAPETELSSQASEEVQSVESQSVGDQENHPVAEEGDTSAALDSGSEDQDQHTLELVFIDSSVSNFQQLIADLQSENARDENRTLEAVVLDSTRDGISQITAALLQHNGVDGVHIVSHGADGQVRLGSTTLSLENLDRYRSAISAWQYSMSADADILIYGCNVAESEEGQELLEQLSELTGAEVAGSEDLTGNELLGGDWDLEFQTGELDTQNAFSDQLIAAWYGTLDIATGLVGHYEFEENGGSTFTDSSGTQNGSLVNSGSWTTDEAVGTYAIDFGSDSGPPTYVAISDNAAQDFGAGDFTVSLWYNDLGIPESIGRLIGDYGGSESGFVIYVRSNGAIEAQLHDGATVSRSIQGIFDGTWNQLTVVRSGSNLDIYHNGVNVSSSSGADGNIDSGNALWIGASGTLGGDYDGKIDDVRLYTRALSSTDVDELVALGPAVSAPPGPRSGYSNPTGGNNSLDYITNVTFAGINNTSGQDTLGYGNYTSEVATVTFGDSNNLSVTIVEENNNHVTAWIDWNQDGDFADPGEEYVITTATSSPGPHTVNIATPGSATLGTTVMRVGHSRGQAPHADGGAQYREFEDYSINVLDGGPQTFTVTNTNDSGAGSLRQAIIDANATSGTDRVVFDITGGGTQVIDLVSALPSITDSILIDGTTQDGWVEGSFLPIVIDANDGNFDGLRFQSGATGSLVRGLVIRDSAYDGIDIAGADSVTVVGNFVGAYDSSGMFVSGEEHGGASITFFGSNNIIGGNTDADRNVIGGADNGVVIVGAAGGQVSGNYIGLDATGQNTVDIFFDGVRLASGATNVTIGGDTTAHRNIIAGVGADGVQVQQEATDNNTIRHNWIGTLADGTSLANVGAHGIFLVTGADNTQIRDNVILGADGAGISIDGSSTSGTYIGGNYIGTNSDESAEGYVNLHGIELAYGANSTTIGAIGDGNVITNVQSEDNAGVRVFANAGTGNQIRGNSIYGNAGLGIDIASENADANDSGDIDTGGNNGQNWAVLKSASINDAGSFAYSMDTTTLAAGTYTIDFYASTDRDGGQVEGQRYLGSASGIANGNTNLTGSLAGITLAPGEYVTLVTTDASGNSSEFSNYAVATDSDAGGSTPADTLVSSTGDGGLSINEDGGNDIYLKADSSPFSGESQVTVEVDFQISTPATGLTTLLSYATGTNQDELYVGIDSGGEVFFRTSSDSGSGYGSVTHAPQLLDGSRHTLSVTWDSTGGILMFYVDGVQLGTGRNDYQELTTIDAGGTLVIGQHQTSPDSGFDADNTFEGTIYGARIFNDIRTTQEIADSYGGDVPFDEAGLIANWRFDDLSNDGVTIDTVAGNNLTVNHTSESGFTASEASLTLRVDENAVDGTIVGAVSGLDADREALIASLLATDPDLVYDAETNSFYKALSGAVNPSTAQSNANSTLLNSVAGKLPTITSFHENELIRSMISSTGNNAVWLSGTDAEVQHQWRWEDGTLFWKGSASGNAVGDSYENFKALEPNGGNNASIVHLAMDGTGQWLDASAALLDTATVVEWDADEVLDATQALAYSIQSQSVSGAFVIDSASGEISVANGLLLDAETLASHSVTVRVTDVDGNSHDEAFTITLNDLVEANTAPTNLSSGIEINTDGGNDVYLQADDGNALLGGASAVTVEFAVQLENPNLQAPHLLSYRTAAEANEFRVYLSTSDGLMLTVGGNSVLGGDGSVLRDGQVHQVSVSWDSTNGLASFYIDGELIGTNTVSTGHSIGSNGTLVIGQGQGIYPQWTHTQAAQGTFYDVRIWDDIRSEAEIALNAQHSFYRGNLPDGLIANWQMDGFDISGEVVDIVGDNNLSVEHATGTGFTASTPIDGLHVDSSGSTGSSAGFVRPTDPDSAQDIVTDGRFHSASDPGASTEYFANQSIGGWTVSHGRVDFVGSSIAPPDGSEYSVQLNGSGGSQNQGGIEQSLATVAGRQYQVIFEVTGDWSTDQDTQQLRVTADSASQDFSVDYDSNWSTSNPLWQQRSMTFTADDDLTLLNFSTLESDVQDGPLVANIRVIEVPAAVRTILGNDSTLTYDAGTNKFYRFVNTNDDFSTQLDNATRANLNGISGGLVRIDSQYENDLIRQFVIDSGNDIWLGASDTNNDGNWNWLDGTSESGDQFWAGGAAGSAATGFYAPTFAQSEAPGEDAARITSDGTWADDTNGSSNAMVIEWDASEVISGFTFSLADASNNFEINSSTGEVTVAATHTLDFASYSLHDVDVTVTDATGNSYVETMTIVVGDQPSSLFVVPGPQTIDEDQVLTFSSANGNAVYVFDGEPGVDATLQVSLSVNDGVLVLSQTTGLTFVENSNGNSSFVINGTESAINAALEGMTFHPDDDFHGAVTLNLSTSLTADVEAQYAFDAGAGGVDSSGGTSHDGTLNGNATVVNDAQRGDVLSLDGSGDYVQIDGLLGEPADVTLAAWINADSLDTFGAVVISLGQSPALYLDASGELVGFYESGGTNNVVQATGSLVGTGWRHVAVSIDAASQMTLYIDGTEVQTTTPNGPIEYDNSPDTYIGRDGTGGTGFDFDGMIDDARVYGRALTDDEIQILATGVGVSADSVAITVDSVNDAPVLARASVREIDFEGSYIYGNVNNQNGWRAEGYNIKVTSAGGVDGGTGLTFDLSGPGVGGSVSLVSDTAVPDLTDAEQITAEFSLKNSQWGGEFAFAHDADLDGRILRSSGEQALTVKLANSTGQITVTTADGSTSSAPNGASPGDWLNFRWDIDLTANAGQGSGTLFFRNVTEGQTLWQTDASLTDINLGLSTVATDKTNPANWDGIFLHMEGAGNGFDNYRIEVQSNLGEVQHVEDGAVTVLAPAVSVFDPELTPSNFAGATLTLARTGAASVDDQFVATGTISTLDAGANNLVVGGTTIGSVTQNSGGTLVLTFNANATNDLVNQAMQQIGYRNTSNTPPASVQIDWTFNDNNSGAQGSGGALTDTGTTTVNITETNDVPTIANLGGDVLAYAEGSGAVVIDQSADSLVTDIDSSDFDAGTLTVSFEAGSDNTEDVLAIANQGTGSGQIGISGSNVSYEGTVIGTFTGGTSGTDLVITFDADADTAAVSALVQAITYENTDTDDPTTGNRTVRYVLTDGDGGVSANYDTTVNVNEVNDAPDGADNTVTTNEDTDHIFTVAEFGFTDVDSTIQGVRIASLPSAGTLFLDSNSDGIIDFGEAIGVGDIVNEGNIDAGRLKFRPVADTNGTPYATFEFQVRDDDGTANGGVNLDPTANTMTINVTPTNDAPTNAGSTPADQTVVEDVATDLDLSDITIADPDENGGAMTVTLATTSGGTLTASSGGGVTITGSGTNTIELDGTLADINTFLDNVTNIQFTGASNAFGDNADAITVTVNDNGNSGSGGGTDQLVATVNVDITAVNDSPVIANLNGDTLAVINDGVARKFDVSSVAFVVDNIDGTLDLDGGSLVLSGNSFEGLDTLGLDTSGAISLSAGFANGSVVSVGGVQIGTMSAVSNDAATISFNSNATITRVDALLQSFTFETTSATPGSRSIDLVLNDGDGTANGGSDTSATATVNISVGLAGNGLVSTNEDTTYTFTGTDFDFTGTTGSSLTKITVTSLPSDGTLQLNGVDVVLNQEVTKAQIDAGQFTFVPDANENGTLYASFDFFVNEGRSTVNVLAGEPNSFTLNGGSLQATDQIIQDASNFGLGGTYSSSITIGTASTTIDSGYLAQGSVLFGGFVPDANYTPAELSAIDTWVNAGGVVISTSDSASYDAISSYYGLTIGGAGNAVWEVADDSHEIMNGPFGLVGSNGSSFSATGSIGYFDSASLAPGDVVLAADSASSEPTIVLRQVGNGWVLFTGDEGIFRANMTGGGSISTANDRLVANIFAWALDSAPQETHQINIDVTAVNDDPFNSGSLPTSVSVDEDVTTVVDLSSLQLADVDSATADLRMTLTTSGGGTLSAAGAGGVTVTGSGTSTLTLDGTIPELNTFLDNASAVSFTGAANDNGVSADGISVSITDNGNVGSGGGGQINLGAVSVDITAINDAPTGLPTITGTVAEDQTLTADTSGIADNDGLGTFTYQWLRDGSAISGATSSTFTLGDADVGSKISVQVSYTDGNGTNEGPLTSAETANVANVNDTPAGLPTITGTATEDQTLTADTSAITDNDGLGTFTYQWLRDGSAISGATSSTFTLGDADVGSKISVQVSYTDANGTNEGPLTSAETADVVNLNDTPTGVPTITGTVTEDQTLTADPSGITDDDGLGTFTYQWLRDGSAIAGATSSTFTLGDADVGSKISVQISYTDGNGTNEGPLTSAETSNVVNVNDFPVLAAPSLSVIEGGTVTLSSSNFSATDIDNDDASLTFQVSSITGGQFERLSAPQQAITSFSQAEITAGQILFIHDGSETAPVFSVTVFDGVDSDGPEAASVSFTNINDAPQITGLGGDSSTVFNSDIPSRIDAGAPARLNDTDLPGNYAGAELQVTGMNFDVADQLGIDASGSIGLSTGYVTGSVVSVGGNDIGTLSAVSASSFRVDFTANATSSDVDAILKSVTFATTSTTLGNRSVDFTFNDADGTADGGVEVSETVTAFIQVAQNGDGLVSTSEDTNYSFQATDFEFTGTLAADLTSITLTSLPTNGTLTVNGIAATLGQEITRAQIDSGVFRFEPVANENGAGYGVFEFEVNNGRGSVEVLAGESSLYTVGGAAFQDTDRILTNPDNFGLSGTYQSGITIVESSNDISVSYLDQGQVLFGGYVDNGQWTSAELANLDSWVQGGGILIATSDSPAYSAVSTYYGLTIGGAGSPTWHIADDSSPVIDGPFGLVGPNGGSISASGTIGYFDSASLAPGDQIIAVDSSNGEPTMVLRSVGDGWVLFTSDEGIFRTNTSSDGTVNTANDRLIANVFAWASSQVDAVETHTMNVDVVAINDDPSNQGSLPASVTVTEDVATSIDLSSISLNDVDSVASDLTLTLSTSSGGVLSSSSTGSVSVTGSGTGTLQLTGSASDLNTYLADAGRVNFTGALNSNGINADAIAVTVNDNGNTGLGGGTNVQLGTVNVNITAVNDAPAVSVPGTQTIVEETTTAITAITVTDPDSSTAVLSTTLSVTNGRLNVSLSGSATISAGAVDSASLTVRGTAADINSTLSSLTYTPNTDVTGIAADSLVVSTNDEGNVGLGAALTTSASVQLNIQNVNDEQQLVVNSGLTVDENSTANAITSSMLRTTDVDHTAAELTYRLTSIPTTGTLNLAGGALQTGDTFTQADINAGRVTYDHSGAELFTDEFAFTVDDGQGTSTSGTFSITIDPVNDHAPVITSHQAGATASVTVAENTSVATVVTATDADLPAQALQFTIVGGQDAALFSVHPVNGTLQFGSLPNYENPLDSNTDNVYQVIVEVSDGQGLTDQQTISVTVTDVNEAAVAAITDADNSPDNVTENVSLGTTVGIVAFAVDSDGTDLVSYSLDNDAGGLFAIDGTTGEVSAAGTIDRETAADHSIVVRAASTDGSFQTRSFTITVSDVDEFDVTPIVDLNKTSNAVDENVAVGTQVGITAFSNDADSTNSNITYTLDDDASGLFAIDAVTGIISTANAIDYEVVGPNHSVTIRATSDDGSTTVRTLSITVRDVNEFGVTVPIDVNAVDNRISENAAVGTSVGLTVSSVDGDTTNSQVSYTLDDNAGGLFQIDPNTGEVSVASAIDFEAVGGLQTITVRATSQDGSSETASFTIAVDDLNDNAPVITPAQRFQVTEHATNGTAVGLVDATDADTVGSLQSWALLSGNESGIFTIDSAGLISVTDNRLLNYEVTSQYVLQIVVSDGQNPAQVTSVIVDVTDQADAPAFQQTGPFSIAENSGNGTIVGTISATDEDVGSTRQYVLTGGSSAFSIDPLTGQIRVVDSSQLNFEATLSFQLDVEVQDNQGLSDTASVTIQLLDVNESPFNLAIDQLSVNENTSAGTFVATATASDVDAGDQVTFHLQDAGSVPFEIDSTTGAITVASGWTLDHESTSTYRVTLLATDRLGLSSASDFEFQILDVNERPVTQDDRFEGSVVDPIVFSVQDLMLNDSDPENDQLVFVSISSPNNGTLTLQSDGTYIYQPDTTFSGVETINYVISDGNLTSVAGTIELIVEAVAGNQTGGDTNPEGGSGESGPPITDGAGGVDATGLNESENQEEESEGDESEDDSSSETNNETRSEVQTVTDAESEFSDETEEGIAAPNSDAQPNIFFRNPNGSLERMEFDEIRVDAKLGDRVGNDELGRSDSRRNAGYEFRFGSQGSDASPFLEHRSFDVTLMPPATEETAGLLRVPDFESLVVSSAAVTSVSVTTGYMIWLLRGGTLVTSMLSSLPLWQRFDPLQVINAFEEEEGESLAELVANSEFDGHEAPGSAN